MVNDPNATLSDRGRVIAKNNIRSYFATILDDPYDAEANPNGFINIGTSENVGCIPLALACFLGPIRCIAVLVLPCPYITPTMPFLLS